MSLGAELRTNDQSVQLWEGVLIIESFFWNLINNTLSRLSLLISKSASVNLHTLYDLSCVQQFRVVLLKHRITLQDVLFVHLMQRLPSSRRLPLTRQTRQNMDARRINYPTWRQYSSLKTQENTFEVIVVIIRNNFELIRYVNVQ